MTNKGVLIVSVKVSSLKFSDGKMSTLTCDDRIVEIQVTSEGIISASISSSTTICTIRSIAWHRVSLSVSWCKLSTAIFNSSGSKIKFNCDVMSSFFGTQFDTFWAFLNFTLDSGMSSSSLSFSTFVTILLWKINNKLKLEKEFKKVDVVKSTSRVKLPERHLVVVVAESWFGVLVNVIIFDGRAAGGFEHETSAYVLIKFLHFTWIYWRLITCLQTLCKNQS